MINWHFMPAVAFALPFVVVSKVRNTKLFQMRLNSSIQSWLQGVLSKVLPTVSSIEGVRARVSQPINIKLLPVCSIRTFRTHLNENWQELYIEGWPTLTLTPSITLHV